MSPEWTRHAGSEQFDLCREAFDKSVQDLREIPTVRTRELERLKTDQRRLQLESFLDEVNLEGTKIPGIGAGRKSQLSSHNDETAADVNHSSVRVPGFGPASQGKLLAWRESLEWLFVFDPTKAIEQRDLMRVEQEIVTERKNAEDAVRASFAELI